jgi:hypothetical protein
VYKSLNSRGWHKTASQGDPHGVPSHAGMASHLHPSGDPSDTQVASYRQVCGRHVKAMRALNETNSPFGRRVRLMRPAVHAVSEFPSSRGCRPAHPHPRFSADSKNNQSAHAPLNPNIMCRKGTMLISVNRLPYEAYLATAHLVSGLEM